MFCLRRDVGVVDQRGSNEQGEHRSLDVSRDRNTPKKDKDYEAQLEIVRTDFLARGSDAVEAKRNNLASTCEHNLALGLHLNDPMTRRKGHHEAEELRNDDVGVGGDRHQFKRSVTYDWKARAEPKQRMFRMQR